MALCIARDSPSVTISRGEKWGNGETQKHTIVVLINNLLHALVVGFGSRLYRRIEVSTLKRAVHEKVELQILKTKLLEFLHKIGGARLGSGMRGVDRQSPVHLGKKCAVGRFQQDVAVPVLHARAFDVSIKIV